jgi:phage terminase large subunit
MTAGTALTLKLQTPKWMVPLLQPARYKAAHGGRGGGKSRGFGTMLIAAHVADPERNTVCIREVQKSLKQSVKKLLEQEIRRLEVGDHFDVLGTEIRSRKGNGVIIFEGMNDHTAESIKSLEGFDCAWVEEAQSFTERSLELLRPTIRKPESELWFSWNPHLKTDPVDVLFRGPDGPPPDSVVVQVNYPDNPWFPEVLKKEEYHARISPKKHHHIWDGGYKEHAEAMYFDNWRVEEFDTPKDAQIRLGLDWGFHPDPLAVVGCYIEGDNLYIDREACEYDVSIRQTPAFLLTVPGTDKLEIVAGSDRPERILDLKEKGFKIFKAVRGPNSVEQGLEWLENYNIIIHPRCKTIADEFSLFSHPVDKLTGKILVGYVDENNHCIEALRYACEAVRRQVLRKQDTTNISYLPTVQRWGGGRG